MKFWPVLALAACIAALPWEAPLPLEASPPFQGVSLHKRVEKNLVHVGYRFMGAFEAMEVSNNGNKAIQSKNEKGEQLGTGVYLTQGFRDWPPFNPFQKKEPMWDCAAFIEEDDWNGLNKAWINQWYLFEGEEGQQCRWGKLWSRLPQSVKDRPAFLRLLNEDFTLENTVRFSEITSHETILQMLIPNEIIARGILHLKYCSEREAEGSDATGAFDIASWNTDKLPGWGIGQFATPPKTTKTKGNK